jgi:hypothetical protein
MGLLVLVAKFKICTKMLATTYVYYSSYWLPSLESLSKTRKGPVNTKNEPLVNYIGAKDLSPSKLLLLCVGLCQHRGVSLSLTKTYGLSRWKQTRSMSR